MRITVVGGTGLIGARLVRQLETAGHQVVVAARSTGVDILTGAGLDRALDGTELVIDVSNPGYGDAAAALRFFETAGATLLTAERAAGIAHHVTFSAIGAERIDRGYFHAKKVQEQLVLGSDIPFTIVRSAPLFEYIHDIIYAGRSEDTVRVPPVRVQPITADDAAQVLMKVALRDPANAIVEVAGPNIYQLPELAEQILTGDEDYRPVLVDDDAPFFGTPLGDAALIAGPDDGDFGDWLRRALAPA